MLEQLWSSGFTVAAHQLGKCWRDGLGVLPDDKKRSCGFNVARKLVMTSPSMRWASCCKVRRESTEAVSWYEKAVELGDPYAAYQLGKTLSPGEQVHKGCG